MKLASIWLATVRAMTMPPVDVVVVEREARLQLLSRPRARPLSFRLSFSTRLPRHEAGKL